MKESFFKAMDQAWAVYLVMKYYKTMSVMHVEQCKAQLEACLDYLAAAKTETDDADSVELYDDAIADTQKCVEALKTLIESVECKDSKASAKTEFKQKQYKAFVKFLYWL